MITVRDTYAAVFLIPMIFRSTSMLGKLSAGPASSKARLGPLPIPASIKVFKIGTSVRVAK